MLASAAEGDHGQEQHEQQGQRDGTHDVGADHGVAVLGINVQDNSDDATEFVRENRLTYPQARSVGEERSEAFGSTGVPENFLVDPRGRLALIWRGAIDERFLREQVLSIVGAKG